MARVSISPNTFRLEPTPTLLGGFSASSGKFHFPRQPLCPYTGADDVEDVELSRTATLWGWTAVTAPPPGYDGPIPYGFGVVELEHERLRVITRITESDPTKLNFGDSMTLVADSVGADDNGNELAVWSFRPLPTYPDRLGFQTRFPFSGSHGASPQVARSRDQVSQHLLHHVLTLQRRSWRPCALRQRLPQYVAHRLTRLARLQSGSPANLTQ